MGEKWWEKVYLSWFPLGFQQQHLSLPCPFYPVYSNDDDDFKLNFPLQFTRILPKQSCNIAMVHLQLVIIILRGGRKDKKRGRIDSILLRVEKVSSFLVVGAVDTNIILIIIIIVIMFLRRWWWKEDGSLNKKDYNRLLLHRPIPFSFYKVSHVALHSLITLLEVYTLTRTVWNGSIMFLWDLSSDPWLFPKPYHALTYDFSHHYVRFLSINHSLMLSSSSSNKVSQASL